MRSPGYHDTRCDFTNGDYISIRAHLFTLNTHVLRSVPGPPHRRLRRGAVSCSPQAYTRAPQARGGPALQSAHSFLVEARPGDPIYRGPVLAVLFPSRIDAAGATAENNTSPQVCAQRLLLVLSVFWWAGALTFLKILNGPQVPPSGEPYYYRDTQGR
jgi:hypothetical protein